MFYRFNNLRSNKFSKVLRKSTNESPQSSQKKGIKPNLATTSKASTNGFIRGRTDYRGNLHGRFKLKQADNGFRPPVFEGFWAFFDGAGAEQVNFEFTFEGEIKVSNFGDDTKQNVVVSGVPFTKTY